VSATSTRPAHLRTTTGGPSGGGRAVTQLAARELRRGTTTVAVLSGVVTLIVAAQYRVTFSSAGSVSSLESLAANPAIRTLFGPPRALDQVGGFTVWRTGTFLAVLVGVWAMLAITRVTRGEEDAGRWALLLAGGVPVRECVRDHLLVAWGAQAVVALCVAVGFVAGGGSGLGAWLYAVAIGLTGAFFAAVGVLAAQVLPDRRSAATAGTAAVVLTLLLRMVADGVTSLRWLGWLSPFGLLGESRPYAGDRVLPLVVLALGAAGVAVAAVQLASHRDIGDALVRLPSEHPPRTRLLQSLPAFLVRRTLHPLVSWVAGIGAYFLLIGLLARSMSDFLTENPQFVRLAAEAGLAELGSVEGYAASLFTLLALPLGLFAAGRLAADAGDEEAGRLTLPLAAPVPRTRWLALHAAVATVECALLAVTAGAAVWLGAVVIGSPLDLADALRGALNVAPVALLSLGAAAVALGWAPRAVLAVGAIPSVGGFLLLSLAESLNWPDAARELSPFSHLAPVPARPADLLAAGVMLVLAAALVWAGAVGFARRDLRA
jgi:ABC-2 type transport system permease protein